MATTAEGQQRLVILGCGAYTMEQGGKARPHPVIVSCLRHACDVRATEGRR